MSTVYQGYTGPVPVLSFGTYSTASSVVSASSSVSYPASLTVPAVAGPTTFSMSQSSTISSPILRASFVTVNAASIGSSATPVQTEKIAPVFTATEIGISSTLPLQSSSVSSSYSYPQYINQLAASDYVTSTSMPELDKTAANPVSGGGSSVSTPTKGQIYPLGVQ